MRKIKYKNLLVQYKGGGYDGCFWEWNYFFFDSKGIFHNVASSGSRGLSNEAEARELLEGVSKTARQVNCSITGRAEFYLYDLSKLKAVKEFCKEVSESHVMGVAEKINHMLPEGRKLYLICGECGEKTYPVEVVSKDGTRSIMDYPWAISTGYHGNGGVGIVSTNYVCEDCYCSGSCSYCGEYYSGHDRKFNDDGYCEHCVESQLKKAV